MAELYKGITGSPITYLASDISAGQTTISIADDSALPDGPNICTIGFGENLETIKYETKSNGVLQNVTRGIEGTPRAWPAGTEVARFFTAYDHNSIIENLNSHLAENANKAHGGYKGAMVKLNTNQSIPDTTETPISWGTPIYDTSNFWNSSNPSRFTVPTLVSKIRLTVFIVWANNYTGERIVFIYKNGGVFWDGRVASRKNAAGQSETTFSTGVIIVSPGDFFEVYVAQKSGNALSLRSIGTAFSIEVIE